MNERDREKERGKNLGNQIFLRTTTSIKFNRKFFGRRNSNGVFSQRIFFSSFIHHFKVEVREEIRESRRKKEEEKRRERKKCLLYRTLFRKNNSYKICLEREREKRKEEWKDRKREKNKAEGKRKNE